MSDEPYQTPDPVEMVLIEVQSQLHYLVHMHICVPQLELLNLILGRMLGMQLLYLKCVQSSRGASHGQPETLAAALHALSCKVKFRSKVVLGAMIPSSQYRLG